MPLRVRVTATLFGLLVTLMVSAAVFQPIGVAISESPFVVGSALVKGQATLFEGDSVRSHYVAARLSLKDGSRFVLGVGAEGKVYKNRLVLGSGSVELSGNANGARIDSSWASVTPAPGSSVTVYSTGRQLVTVLVHKGEARVSRSGATVATIREGQALALQPGKRG